MTARDAVAEASRLVVEMTSRGGNDVAQRYGLAAGLVRDLRRPSRWPKRIGAEVYRRVVTAYLAFCRQELQRLETEIARVVALDCDLVHTRELLAKAETIAARLRTLLKP